MVGQASHADPADHGRRTGGSDESEQLRHYLGRLHPARRSAHQIESKKLTINVDPKMLDRTATWCIWPTVILGNIPSKTINHWPTHGMLTVCRLRLQSDLVQQAITSYWTTAVTLSISNRAFLSGLGATQTRHTTAHYVY
jgi:hypothetical protein